MIFLQLLNGEKLTKRELMDFYGKDSSTIRRDMAIIENAIEEKAEERFLNREVNHDDFEEYLEVHSLDRSEKGYYKLKGFDRIKSNESLTDKELFIILKILLASRSLNNRELDGLYNKLISMVGNQKKFDYFFKNEKFHYIGVSEIDLIDKVELICEIILKRSVVEFEYTKNGQTETFQRTPNAVYFSDLYFYVITSSQSGKDDEYLEDLNKFRISNIENLRVVKTNVRMEYKERFEGGALRKQTAFPFLGKPIIMVIEFNYDPIYVLERFPDSKIISEKDGIYQIEMQVNDGYGMKMWLLSQGKMVKVISPKHMRDYVINDMKVALEAYGLEVQPKESN